METKLIFSSTDLPDAGRPIDFLLVDRSVPIHGSFANGLFHTRWADYETERVHSWCDSEDEHAPAALESPKATLTVRLRRTLKRWWHVEQYLKSY